MFSLALKQARLFSCEERPSQRKKKSHLPILLFTLPLVLSASSSRPLGCVQGAVGGRGAWGGTVLPWDRNCRFRSAQHRRPWLSVRLGVSMHSGHSACGQRLRRCEGGGRWWDGSDLGGGYSSKRPRCLIESHAGCGSDFGYNSRGNRLNYFSRLCLCGMKNRTETHKTTPNACTFLSRDFSCSQGTCPTWREAQKQALPRLQPWNVMENNPGHAFQERERSQHAQSIWNSTMPAPLSISKTDTPQIKLTRNWKTALL